VEDKGRIGHFISSIEELARLLAVTPGNISHIASRLGSHYRPRRRHKKDGGVRVLNVPNEELMLFQRKINAHILNDIPLLPCVYGGVRYKCILDCAQQHVNKKVVHTMDIVDFFGTVKPSMVRAVFERASFRGDAAALLTRLTTFDGQLPQGAPTSTPLANLVLLKLDRRFVRLAEIHDFKYTRWVDDLSFSGGHRLLKLLSLLKRVVEDEGFAVSEAKTKTMFQYERQEVLNLTVNRKVNLNCEKTAAIKKELADALATGNPPSNSTMGRVYWLRSVNRAVGSTLARKVRDASAGFQKETPTRGNESMSGNSGGA
jgi:RNA-directed DNA polymerase